MVNWAGSRSVHDTRKKFIHYSMADKARAAERWLVRTCRLHSELHRRLAAQGGRERRLRGDGRSEG